VRDHDLRVLLAGVRRHHLLPLVRQHVGARAVGVTVVRAAGRRGAAVRAAADRRGESAMESPPSEASI